MLEGLNIAGPRATGSPSRLRRQSPFGRTAAVEARTTIRCRSRPLTRQNRVSMSLTDGRQTWLAFEIHRQRSDLCTVTTASASPLSPCPTINLSRHAAANNFMSRRVDYLRRKSPTTSYSNRGRFSLAKYRFPAVQQKVDCLRHCLWCTYWSCWIK